MELASVQTPAAALMAGVVTSLHCAGMCGPLSCWITPVRPEDDGLTLAAAYQVSRIFGYTVLGAVAGAIGQAPLAWLGQDALRYFPWLVVLFLFAVGLGWEKRLPRPLALARLSFRLQAWLRGRSRLAVAATLGIATPILPCGPLYFLVAIAAFSGSALAGAEFMLCFGLGTLPLLWVVQSQFGRLRERLSPRGLARLQTALALVTALVMAWRLRGTLGLGGGGPGDWSCFG